jgi:hypothetical protein
MKTKLNKSDQIKYYFINGGKPLSVLECTIKFRYTKLTSRVSEWRRDGWKIKNIECKIKGANFVKYQFISAPKKEVKRLAELVNYYHE